MWLPTKDQVNTAERYAGAIAGTAVTIFGLQNRGISLDQIKDVIQALGDTVNQLAILAGASAALYAGVKGVFKSSPTQQAASLTATASGPASPAAVEAQKAIIQATSTIAQDKTIPASQEAANTLVKATIALPQVQTIAADETTRKAVGDPSVVSASSPITFTKVS